MFQMHKNLILLPKLLDTKKRGLLPLYFCYTTVLQLVHTMVNPLSIYLAVTLSYKSSPSWLKASSISLQIMITKNT